MHLLLCVHNVQSNGTSQDSTHYAKVLWNAEHQLSSYGISAHPSQLYLGSRGRAGPWRRPFHTMHSKGMSQGSCSVPALSLRPETHRYALPVIPKESWQCRVWAHSKRLMTINQMKQTIFRELWETSNWGVWPETEQAEKNSGHSIYQRKGCKCVRCW